MAVVGALLGVAQLGIGLYNQSQAKDEANSALKQRKRYQTPAELFKILSASQSASQTGFDPSTLSYLTNNLNSSFDSALYTDKLLGGDPNSMSALFNNKVDAIMKIGGQDHALKMENFTKYLQATKMIADSKDAEFFSGQSMVKDMQQKAAADMKDSTSQISGGINTALSSISNYEIGGLYNEERDKAVFTNTYGKSSKEEAYAKANNMSFNAYQKKLSKVGNSLGSLSL